MDRKPQQKTGVARIWAAFFYSLDGLRLAVSNEAAFRQELCVIAVALIVLIVLPLSSVWKGILFLTTTSVLVVELLNSSIESVVDMASPEYHVLAKRAKDFGSAAVLLSIVVALLLWLGAISSVLQSNLS
jgi:diacylglycerol kinase (ATP)